MARLPRSHPDHKRASQTSKDLLLSLSLAIVEVVVEGTNKKRLEGPRGQLL